MLYQKILYHPEVGELTVLSDCYYIRKLEFGKRDLMPEAQWDTGSDLILETDQQLAEYFRGVRMQFDLSIDPIGTSFQKSVWRQLCCIPYGQTQSYRQIAEAIGNPRAARAVGGACHRNSIAIIIPCHRVIGTSGNLTGFAWGLTIKNRLLTLEQQNISNG